MFLGILDYSRHCGLKDSFIRKLVRQKTLPHVMVGKKYYIPTEEADKFLSEMSIDSVKKKLYPIKPRAQAAAALLNK